jgi:FMN reductase [NAD(P)H]
MIKRLGPVGFSRSLLRILRGGPNIPESLEDSALLRAILRRRSVRRYADAPIPDDVFQAILEAGRVAPSTVNLQTWSFAVFTSGTWQEKFGRPIPFRAQRAVIVLADTHRARAVLDVFPSTPLVEYTIGVMNASLAAMAMNLAAEALGVSSVMLSETGRSGFLDANHLIEALGLPPHVIPLMTIVFGYRRGALPPMPPRLPLETIAFTGSYRNTDRDVMEAWLDEMIAGYKASRPGSSFEAQLKIYRDKLEQAERDLKDLVFSANGAPGEP